MKKEVKRFCINLGLLLFGLLTMFSGWLIQVQYHMGYHGSESGHHASLDLNYSSWSNIHKFSIIILSVLTVFHIYLHGKWYKAVIARRLMNKNRQVLILTLVFLLVAITGFIPWGIDLMEGSAVIRKVFIEVHDKIAIVLSLFFVLHMVRRLNWFLSAFEKIKR